MDDLYGPPFGSFSERLDSGFLGFGVLDPSPSAGALLFVPPLLLTGSASLFGLRWDASFRFLHPAVVYHFLFS